MTITPEEFKERMIKLSEIGDTEERHVYMDDLLCAVLEGLGYGEGIEIFEETDMWYA